MIRGVLLCGCQCGLMRLTRGASVKFVNPMHASLSCGAKG
jgi:hypothetical protein